MKPKNIGLWISFTNYGIIIREASLYLLGAVEGGWSFPIQSNIRDALSTACIQSIPLSQRPSETAVYQSVVTWVETFNVRSIFVQRN